ncbi:hypothetical protein E4U54_004993 [Claviceps lovelessii]|nr:hypothetical protein E4U54_004993 [Claviceps lovelessii]
MPLPSLSSSLKLASLALLTAITQAVPLNDDADTRLPTNDAFYSLPDDLAAARPGDILRHRKPPASIAAFRVSRQNLKDSHQILYRTTDNFGNATATVLTVLVPHNADYGKIVSQQSIEDAPYANCAPSYALQLGSNEGGLFGTIQEQSEIILIDAFLAEGWIVIVPDYEGPRGEFLANIQAGNAVLDGVRAALASTSITGISKNASVALNGYSGGAVASSFAAERQPSYAPELKIAGAAIGGPVPNLANSFKAMNKGPFAGLIPAGIGGLSITYPAIEKLMQDQLLQRYMAKFYKARKQCLGPTMLENVFTDYLSQVREPSTFSTDPALSVLNANSAGKHVPTMPLFVFKSVYDEVSFVADTDALVQFYCDGGTPVRYIRDLASEHATLAVTGATLVLPWLKKVLNGQQAVPGGCSTVSVVTTLNDPSTAGLPKFFLNALKGLLGRPIGPGGVLKGHE